MDKDEQRWLLIILYSGGFIRFRQFCTAREGKEKEEERGGEGKEGGKRRKKGKKREDYPMGRNGAAGGKFFESKMGS